MNSMEWNEKYWLGLKVLDGIKSIGWNEKYWLEWKALNGMKSIEWNEKHWMEWIVLNGMKVLNGINSIEWNEKYWMEWKALNGIKIKIKIIEWNESHVNNEWRSDHFLLSPKNLKFLFLLIYCLWIIFNVFSLVQTTHNKNE